MAFFSGHGIDWPMPAGINWQMAMMGGEAMTLDVEYILRMQETSLFACQIEHSFAGDWTDGLSTEKVTQRLEWIRDHASSLLELELANLTLAGSKGEE